MVREHYLWLRDEIRNSTAKQLVYQDYKLEARRLMFCNQKDFTNYQKATEQRYYNDFFFKFSMNFRIKAENEMRLIIRTI